MTRPLSRTGISLGIASALTLAEGETSSTVQLLAMGENPTRNGEPLKKLVLRDRAHAEAVVAASLARAGATDIVIDYDHQTVFAAQSAGRAEAAGWIKRLYATDEGVQADVEWTADAAAALVAKKYRYISPYYSFDKASGEFRSVINAGLTNTPNFDLLAVASSMPGFTEEEDDTMNLKAIASALGLGEGADEAAILAAIGALNAKGAALSATASALGVTLGDDVTAVATAATALKTAVAEAKPDPAKFVPISTVAELQTGLASANTQLATLLADKRQAKIDAAVAEGRLPPALVDHAKTITDDTALASFLAALPANSLGKSSVDGGDKPGGDDGKLSADELAVATAMGLSEEEFLAAKKKEA